MNGQPWSEEELEMLSSLAGELPLRLLANEYNKWAKRKRYPIRTMTALSTKARRLGHEMKASGEYLSARSASILLGCKTSVLSNWVKLGRLPGIRYSDAPNSIVWVKRSDIRALAKRKPEYFNGFSYSGLIYLLEDEALVDKITSTKWKRSYGRPRPVVMLSTGRRFDSAVAASRAVGLARNVIREAAINNWTCAGSKWRFISPDR